MPSTPVVSWEMTAKDIQKQAHFYSELFGWKFEFDESSAMASVATGGIDGTVVQLDGPQASDIYLYIQVPNVQAVVDKTVGLGGSVVSTATGPSDHIPTAFIMDPEGSVWGLVQEAK